MRIFDCPPGALFYFDLLALAGGILAVFTGYFALWGAGLLLGYASGRIFTHLYLRRRRHER